MAKELPPYVLKALAGEKEATEALLAEVHDYAFNLAMRFLGNPSDAQDACQEICLKVWTNLGKFRGESQFSTWVLAIAGNYLLGVKKSRLETAGLSFEAYEAEAGAVPSPKPVIIGFDEQLLAEELRHSCSLGMLQCLDRTDRLVYVLHCFFGVTSAEGAIICELSAEAFRQRLVRVRKKMAVFLVKVCGLAGNEAACTCKNRVMHAFQQGRIKPDGLFYSTHIQSGTISAMTSAMEFLYAESAVFRHDEKFQDAESLASIRRIVAEKAPILFMD